MKIRSTWEIFREGFLIPLLWMSLGAWICGCAARPYTGPKWTGPWPQDGVGGHVACGVPTKMTDGSVWTFPCWPEKDIPMCVRGCSEPPMYRIAWSSKLTGAKGHGEWMPWTESQAVSILVEANASTPELWHWMERKP